MIKVSWHPGCFDEVYAHDLRNIYASLANLLHSYTLNLMIRFVQRYRTV